MNASSRVRRQHLAASQTRKHQTKTRQQPEERGTQVSPAEGTVGNAPFSHALFLNLREIAMAGRADLIELPQLSHLGPFPLPVSTQIHGQCEVELTRASWDKITRSYEIETFQLQAGPREVLATTLVSAARYVQWTLLFMTRDFFVSDICYTALGRSLLQEVSCISLPVWQSEP